MQLLVNADDFGMSHEKNIAIDYLMKNDLCTNASLIINMPFSTEAIKFAIEGGYQDKVSLHLNLTIGKSLSTEIRNISLYYNENEFAYRPIIKIFKQIFPLHVRTIRKEIDSQINKFLESGMSLKNIDSHNWVHLRIPVWLALKPLLKQYKISIIRPMWVGYKRPEIASKKWSRYFKIISPFLKCCPQYNIIAYSSNIEQFLLYKEKIPDDSFVEVFTHPDYIDNQIWDLSSSYTGDPKNTVVNNLENIKEISKVTISKILKEIEK